MSRIKFSALSERGLRERNDDAYCAEQIGKYFVLAIADGLSNHPFGDVASMTAINALKATVKKNTGPARDLLLAGIRSADAEIKALSQRSPDHAGLATTLVACLIDDKMNCTVLDIGGKNCTIITKSTVENARTIAKARHLPGTRTAPSAAPRPPVLSDMISHALGAPYRLKETDFSEFILENEFLLLSSDGLTGVMDKEAVAGIIRKNGGNLEAASEMLVQEAMKAGSESTITVILAH